MKKILFMMAALLACGGLTLRAQSIEFQYQGKSLQDGATVTIAAEADAFGELSCETNPSSAPDQGLVLKLADASLSTVDAELQILHNTLDAKRLQWCMGGECTLIGSKSSLMKTFDASDRMQVLFDASNIGSTGYLMAKLSVSLNAKTLTVYIQFSNGETADVGTEMWWGYFNESEASALPYNGNYGYSKACTIETAIYVPANHNIVDGTTIKGIRIWMGNQITNISGDLTLWISTTLPENLSSAAYTQTVPGSSLVSGLNEFQLTTPFPVNGTDIYVGFSFAIGSRAFPVMTGGYDLPNAFFYRIAGYDWENLSNEGSGKLALQLLLDGVSLRNNSATPHDFGLSYVETGKSTNVPVLILNLGSEPMTSFSYTITTGSETTEEVTVNIPTLAFNNARKYSIPFKADADTREFAKTLTITKVNGMANECNKKTATGSLITITEKPAVVPVVEEFTGTWCGWCPIGFDGMEKTHETFGDKVALIAVHCDDVMTVSEYQPVAYMANGYPSSIINRSYYAYPSEGELNYYVNSELNNKIAVASIQATATWTSSAKTAIQIETNTKFVYSDDQGEYAIAYALVEDGMTGTGSGWSQNNNLSKNKDYSSLTFWYNASSVVSDLQFNHVAVDAWNIEWGVDGSVSTPIKAGVNQHYSFVADIGDNTIIQDKSKLKVVVQLINRKTGEIENAALATISDISSTDIDIHQMADCAPTTRYSLDGRRLTLPQKGVNIVRMGDGSVRKVMKK